MSTRTYSALGAFALLLLAGCGERTETLTVTIDPKAGAPKTQTPTPAIGAEPKDAIAYQLELLKAGDVEKLRACFTERQKERITPEAVAEGKQAVANQTLADLVASVELGEHEGQETAKIMMASGRTLTTLIKTDGVWLADTVWFK